MKRVRVIGESGEQLGIVTVAEAVRIADRERATKVHLELSVKPPVYRIMEADRARRIARKRKGK